MTMFIVGMWVGAVVGYLCAALFMVNAREDE